MAWHVLSSTHFDLDRFARESEADSLPEHLLPQIVERLGASLHMPDDDSVSALDRFGALFYAAPQHWALARRVYPLLNDGDSVYSSGCDAGVPLALMCALRHRDISFAIAFADPTRIRTKIFGWIAVLLSLRLTAIVTTNHQIDLTLRSFGRRIAGVHAIEGQTDCRFFRPAVERSKNEPPLVASCGVERRDYLTMANALADVDVQARVCFESPNRTSKTRFTVPDPAPTNFDFGHFEFDELRTLYQQADLVVLPLLENRYSAGLTTLFEAIACGAPVVVTRSPGTIDSLIDEGLIIGVPAGDAIALKTAVTELLADPQTARVRAEAARTAIMDRYSATRFLDRLQGILVRPGQSLQSP
ncbi:MAG: glycosyltransferase family 4 protein [Acidimicrobiales bacterium]